MSLAMLAPAALALGVLLVGPVLAHLARQHPRDRVVYGAMLLIERLQRRIRRRRRLRDRLLLALRLLALLSFIVAAARPELRTPGSAPGLGASGRVVVVLDDSLSMDQRIGSDPAFVLARKDAAATVRTLPPGVEVAVVSAGGVPEIVLPFSGDVGVAAAVIEARERGFGGTDLHGALTLTRDLLGGEPGEVLVYTDEAGPGVVERCQIDLERLNATGAAVVPRIFRADPVRNVVPVEAAYGDGLEGGVVTARIVNYGPDAVEVQATVELPDGATITAFVEVAAADAGVPGEATERFTVPRQAQGGVARLTVEDPELPADNVRWFHLPRIGASRVLVADGDPGSTPTRSEVYFLERALVPWSGGGVAVDVVAPSGVSALSADVHRVAWLANVADPGPSAAVLVDFVRRGGGLVLAMGDLVTPERYNGPLASILPAPLRRPRDLVALDASDGEALVPPDLSSELFAPFASSGAGAFSRLRARRVMTVESYAESEDVRTLLRFASGVPALIERRIGNGRVLLWTSTLDLGWGNFPVENIFLPWVQRLTAFLGGELGTGADRRSGEVGVPLEMRLPPGAASEVTDPAGAIVAAEREGSALRFVPAIPGAWQVGRSGEPPVAWVAVNTSPAESDVRTATGLGEVQMRIDPERLADRTPLWMGALALAALAFVGAAVVGRGRDEAAA